LEFSFAGENQCGNPHVRVVMEGYLVIGLDEENSNGDLIGVVEEMAIGNPGRRVGEFEELLLHLGNVNFLQG
jgi:hypothetical protein